VDHTGTVNEYFGTYLGASPSSVARSQLLVVASDRRTKPETGWGNAFAVWAFLLDDRGVVSVRPDLYSAVARQVRAASPTTFSPVIVRSLLSEACPTTFASHWSVVYVCDKTSLHTHNCPGCRRMGAHDVEAYIALKRSMWPELDAECERSDISRNIGDGIAYAVFVDSRIVSASSAPRVAHMNDRVEEAAVDTHPDFRGRGYGRCVISGMTDAVLGLGRTPIYRASGTNVASSRVAVVCGYRKVADNVVFRPA